MARRPKIEPKECATCDKKGCFICLNFSEYEPDIRKEIKGKPSERDYEELPEL